MRIAPLTQLISNYTDYATQTKQNLQEIQEDTALLQLLTQKAHLDISQQGVITFEGYEALEKLAEKGMINVTKASLTIAETAQHALLQLQADLEKNLSKVQVSEKAYQQAKEEASYFQNLIQDILDKLAKAMQTAASNIH